MLEILREVGESTVIRYPESSILITLLQLPSSTGKAPFGFVVAATEDHSRHGVVELVRKEPHRLADDLVIQLMGVRGSRVRLGIDAPPHVSVHRWEVEEQIRRGSKL